MRVTFDNNVLTVVTDVTEEVVKAGISDLKARDEKGNQVYGVVKVDSAARIGEFEFAGNAYIDGKLAAQVLVKDGTTLAEIQKTYGEHLLKAAQYTAQISTEAADKKESIEGLFEAQA